MTIYLVEDDLRVLRITIGNKSYRTLLLVIALCLIAGVLSAIDYAEGFLEGFDSRVWTMADGLPGNTVTDIIQDQDGYICIGTYEGLAKFDGIVFTVINRAANPKYAFASARVLYQDKDGNTWVGSNSEGIARISPSLEVTIWSEEDGLPNSSVRSICEDLKGNIWVGTAGGVVYISSDKDIIHPEGLEKYGNDGMLVESISCDTQGRIWVTTPDVGGVYYYTNDTFTRYDGLNIIDNAIVDSMGQDARGALWFGVSPHYAVKIDEGGQRIYDLGNSSERGAAVHSIMQDKAGNMWFGLESGVAVLHNEQLYFYNQLNGLVDNNVRKVIEDREGNIWIATDRGGIQKLTLSKFKVTTLPTSVNAIAQNNKTGTTWIGTDEGLYCYDKDLMPVYNNVTELCKSSRVRHLGFDSHNNLLVSTYGVHAQIRVEQDGSITSWNDSNGLSGNKTRVALEASNGDLYIGTTRGLNIIDAKTGKITLINRESGINNEFIMCLCEDSAGTIWVGTDGGGIFTLNDKVITRVYTSTYRKVGQMQFSFEAGEGLAGNVIFKISQIGDNEIWICTGTGISRLKDDKFFNFTSANGLGTDSIFQMIVDFTGRVWLTSNRGIAYTKLSSMEDMADGKSHKLNVKYSTTGDSKSPTGITATSLSTIDKDGRIWFTLIDGFAIYDPVKVNLVKLVPGIHIEKMTVDNSEYEYDGSTLVIPPRSKRLIVQYTGLTFISPDQLLFKYKLDGFERDYSEWQKDRTVSYTNLKPGKYSFNVIALNSDDVESPPSAVLNIVKQPLFYQHWYFWPLVVLLAVGLLLLSIYARIQKLKHNQQLLEAEVSRQTAEIRQKSRDLEIAKNKSERLLLNILPQAVAKELSDSPNKIIARGHEGVSILFSDIVGFTKMSSTMEAVDIVNMLNKIFTKFDLRAETMGVEKIKTIGDAYMAVCGLSSHQTASTSADIMLGFARGMLEDLEEFNLEEDMHLEMRIGINTGNIVAGVIGKTKFIYDIWGDSVNVASRMESTGVAGKVHLTEATFGASKGGFDFTPPVEIEVKGKGTMKTYFLKS